MPYLIDGHNLIGQLPDISLDDPNDEALLVQKLQGYVARTRQRCVVVFDHGLPGGASSMSTRGVTVVFASASHSNADRVMMERIQRAKDPKGWTVVSSDNEVLSMARRFRMKPLRSTEFAAILRRPEPDSPPGREEAADPRVTPDEVDEWLRHFSKPYRRR